MRPRRRSLSAVSTMSAVLLLASCTVPPGYKHDESSIWPFAKVWVPGSPDPDHAHVHAGANEGHWDPDAGYTWVDGTTTLQVKWTPGQMNPDHTHVYAFSVEGEWVPDDGYGWSNYDPATQTVKSLDVQWTPYIANRNHEHVLAFKDAGYWLTSPGYKFKDLGTEVTSNSNDLDVVWNPGVIHPSCPQMKADNNEGDWDVIDGYSLVSNDPHHLVIQQNAQTSDDNKAGRIAFDIFAAIVANAISQPRDNDGMGAKVFKAGAEEVRNRAVVDAVGTATSSDMPGQIQCDLTSTAWTRKFTQPG